MRGVGPLQLGNRFIVDAVDKVRSGRRAHRTVKQVINPSAASSAVAHYDPASSGPGPRFQSPVRWRLIINNARWSKAPNEVVHHPADGRNFNGKVLGSDLPLPTIAVVQGGWRTGCPVAPLAIPPRCGRGMGESRRQTPWPKHGDARDSSRELTAPQRLRRSAVPYIQTDAALTGKQWRSPVNAGPVNGVNTGHFGKRRRRPSVSPPGESGYADAAQISRQDGSHTLHRVWRLQALTPSWPGR